VNLEVLDKSRFLILQGVGIGRKQFRYKQSGFYKVISESVAIVPKRDAEFL